MSQKSRIIALDYTIFLRRVDLHFKQAGILHLRQKYNIKELARPKKIDRGALRELTLPDAALPRETASANIALYHMIHLKGFQPTQTFI